MDARTPDRVTSSIDGKSAIGRELDSLITVAPRSVGIDGPCRALPTAASMPALPPRPAFTGRKAAARDVAFVKAQCFGLHDIGDASRSPAQTDGSSGRSIAHGYPSGSRMNTSRTRCGLSMTPAKIGSPLRRTASSEASGSASCNRISAPMLRAAPPARLAWSGWSRSRPALFANACAERRVHCGGPHDRAAHADGFATDGATVHD